MPSTLPRLALYGLLGTSLFAQSVIVPAANATVRSGTQLNSILRNAGNPRTYMLGTSAAELAGIPVGAMIQGISVRFSNLTSNPLSWPGADITWNNYDILVGPCIPLASFTGNLLANFQGQPTQVRTGSMVLPAGSFSNVSPTGTTPNPWSEFYFDFQVPHLYLGGDLAFLFSHPGSNDTALAMYPETVAANAAAHGVGFAQSVYPASSATAAAATTFYVHRVHYGYGTGCPGTNQLVPMLVEGQDTSGGLGGSILLTVANAPASAPCILGFGFGSTPVPLPNGCTLLTVPVGTVFLLLSPLGRGALSLAVPPGVLARIEAQAFVFDLGASGGFTVTNGVSPTAR